MRLHNLCTMLSIFCYRINTLTIAQSISFQIDQDLAQNSNAALAFCNTKSSVGPTTSCAYVGKWIDVRFRRKTGYCVCRRAVDVSLEPWYRNSLGVCPASSVGVSRCSAATRKHLSEYFSCMQGARPTNRDLDLLAICCLASQYQHNSQHE
jgi:hypothetical protein